MKQIQGNKELFSYYSWICIFTLDELKVDTQGINLEYQPWVWPKI